MIGLRVEAGGSGLQSGEVRVTLWDDGGGLPAERSGGTGVGLIDGLARQAGATAAWSGDGGTRLVLSMPAPSAGATSADLLGRKMQMLTTPRCETAGDHKLRRL